MADEHRVHPVPGIDFRFEREQAQHAIHAAADLLRPALAPGPHGRAHVLRGANAARLQAAGKTKIEIRRVDADEHVGAGLREVRDHIPPQLQQLRQMLQHLDETHDGEFSSGQSERQPAACMPGPAMPSAENAGWRRASSSSMPAARMSPEASPATMPIFKLMSAELETGN